MINLKPLKTCSHYEFDKIHESKRNPIYSDLSLIREDIRERYIEYYQQFSRNQFETITPSPFKNTSRAALKHCYEYPVNALQDLKVRIKQNQKNVIKGICQFCGMDSDNTFDHYLPKEIFPEFNINHFNLIPCCSTCNQKKGIFWYNKNKKHRGILNLYKDPLPNEQYLFIDVSIMNGLPIGNYYIKNNKGLIGSDIYIIIEQHYKQLNLIKRYNERFSNTFQLVFNSIKPSIKADLNINIIKKILAEEINDDIADFGINQFRTVVKKELLNNDKLLNDLIKSITN